MIFQMLEDPDDGYRSHLGAVRIPDHENNIGFFKTPIAKIKLETSETQRFNKSVPGDFRGYVLVDISDNHIWALIGTGNTDDYYPFVVLEYNPKFQDKI